MGHRDVCAAAAEVRNSGIQLVVDVVGFDLNAAQNPANNFSPLFKIEGDKVLRRKDVNDLNDKHWTNDWWGWSTYLLLKDYKPNQPAS